ncbi:hypothetical protein D3C84_1244810 [compost metagenome]
MRRRYHQHIRLGGLACPDARLGVFKHQALLRRHVQALGGQAIAGGVGLAVADVFGGDHHPGTRDPLRFHTTQGQCHGR